MANNPDYFAIAEQLKTQTDPVIRQQLRDQLYVFNALLTQQEKDLFNYIQEGYIEDNPADDGDSYVGNYKDF